MFFWENIKIVRLVARGAVLRFFLIYIDNYQICIYQKDFISKRRIWGEEAFWAKIMRGSEISKYLKALVFFRCESNSLTETFENGSNSNSKGT